MKKNIFLHDKKYFFHEEKYLSSRRIIHYLRDDTFIYNGLSSS